MNGSQFLPLHLNLLTKIAELRFTEINTILSEFLSGTFPMTNSARKEKLIVELGAAAS